MNSAGPRRVGEDAADRAGREIDVLGTIGLEPVVDRRLIAQIELLARRGLDLDGTELALEPPEDRGPREPAMAGDEDTRPTISWPARVSPCAISS